MKTQTNILLGILGAVAFITMVVAMKEGHNSLIIVSSTSLFWIITWLIVGNNN